MPAPTLPSSISAVATHRWESSQGLYDATSGGSAVTADGAQIARWEDLIGSTHLTEGTANNRPLLNVETGNVEYATRSLNASMRLQASLVVNRNSFFIAMVIDLATVMQAYQGTNLTMFLISLAPAIYCSYDPSTGNLRVFVGAFVASTLKILTSRCSIVFTGSASSYVIWLNGVKQAVGSAPSSSSSTTLAVGMTSASSDGYVGAIREIVLGTTNLSDSAADDWWTYARDSQGAVATGASWNVAFEGDSCSVGLYPTLNRTHQRRALPAGARYWNESQAAVTLQARLGSTRSSGYYDATSDRNVTGIWLGTNDFTGGRTGAQVWADTLTRLAELKAQNATQRLYFIAPFYRGATYETQRQDWLTLARAAFATATGYSYLFEGSGANAGQLFLDIAAIPGIDAMSSDLPHPNDTGHATIATYEANVFEYNARPQVDSATTSPLGDEIWITATKTLSAADDTKFTITASGGATTVTGASVNGAVVTLTLSRPITFGETITADIVADGMTDATTWLNTSLAESDVPVTNDTTDTPLAEGTALFVSSGPAGISLEATPPTGGHAPYSYQWQRSNNGGAWNNLSGETSLTILDETAVADVLYSYRCQQTDIVPDSVNTNSVDAVLYEGGPAGGAVRARLPSGLGSLG